ncbi:MAG: DNA-binding protein [Deltaproteobacteria bacterium]|nr:MAG: DNA-binding protein [Deltaproteobacteria bacterium]
MTDRLSGKSGSQAAEKHRRRRKAKTIARKQMLRERKKIQLDFEMMRIADQERPRTRADCMKMGRPCLFVSCKHHLYLDVNPVTGSIKINFPDLEIWELAETCALDVAERGGLTLEEVGEILNLTRERIRQVEASGLKKIMDATGEDELKILLDD